MLSIALLAAAASGCPAPPVRTADNPLLPREFVRGSRWIGPKKRRLYAVLWAGRAVQGRFSVYAHGFNPVTGINEKIMWVVPAKATGLSASWLRLEWRRRDRRFVQRNTGYPGRDYARTRAPRIYPSILEPPDPGCWKLRVRTGHIKSTMYVIVQPQPSAARAASPTTDG